MFFAFFSMCFASKSIWIQYDHQVHQQMLNPIHKYWLLQLQYTLHFHQNELQLGMVSVYLKIEFWLDWIWIWNTMYKYHQGTFFHYKKLTANCDTSVCDGVKVQSAAAKPVGNGCGCKTCSWIYCSIGGWFCIRNLETLNQR